MHLYESEIDVPLDLGASDIFECLGSVEPLAATDDTVPIRFVVTGPTPGRQVPANMFHCEVGFLSGLSGSRCSPPVSIFDFRRRLYENQDQFTAVFLVPTGIGAAIGGHAGDATPAAKTLAAVCDRLIVHPNVVNAADINEMSANMLYVEGSVISRVLMGTAGLTPVRSNRIMTVIHRHDEKIIVHNAINAVNAARAAGGYPFTDILALPEGMCMSTRYSSAGRATGAVSRFDLLCDLVAEYRVSCDAVAISTVVDVDRDLHDRYFGVPDVACESEEDDIVNPWGGIEALLTHALSSLFDMPTAHSPMYEDVELMNSDPDVMHACKAAEGISVAFLHCLFKGLSASPRIVTDPSAFGRHGVVSAEDISCVIVPQGCLGLPVLAALHQGITLIEVRDNGNMMRNSLKDLPWAEGQYLEAESYFEAAGMVAAKRAGVALDSVKRPLGLARGSDMMRGSDHKTAAALKLRTG